ncbi:hypothetical protein C8R44DRAFT_745109 [Mycena epipterygia]|nr:hypothetical protein C8R44DRAFT_745109 [Mycena epipterygia]
MGVDGADTSKLGWTRGQTYFDTYVPALPKKAILGAAGYQTEEAYTPYGAMYTFPNNSYTSYARRQKIFAQGEPFGRFQLLVGGDRFTSLRIPVRAAIFQKCPKSALFRLPAFADSDVQNWMKTMFPKELVLLQANAGSPVDLAMVQNDVLRKSLQDLFQICSAQEASLRKLQETLERRTAALWPAQGFFTSTYDRNGKDFSSEISIPASSSIFYCSSYHPSDRRPLGSKYGTYHTSDDRTNLIRAFVNSSPKSPDTARATIQSARWPDVFPLIHQPKMCWAVWSPTKTVNKYIDVDELWTTYIDGEAVYNDAGVQTGMKPPLQLVEKYFQKLEAMRGDGKSKKGLNWLRLEVEKLRKECASTASVSAVPVTLPLETSLPTTTLPSTIPSPSTIPALGPAFSLQEDEGSKRKRAAPLDPRRPKKITLRARYIGTTDLNWSFW